MSGCRAHLQVEIGPFLKLLLVRALRVDRCILTCKEFIRNTAQMGPKYVEPVTDTMESIFQVRNRRHSFSSSEMQ